MKVLIDGQTLYTPEIYRGIGVYFKNILTHILECDFINDFYINIADYDILRILKPWVREKIRPLVNSIYHPQNATSAPDLYSEILNRDIKTNRIDIYWNPNPLMHNICLPVKKSNCCFVATIHDLIPLVMKEIYLKQWSSEIVKKYFESLEILKKYYDYFICDSSSTKNDVVNFLKIEDKRCFVIYLGVSGRFYPYPFPKIPREDKYILYVGGFDPRKNMDRTVEAFALFHKIYRADEIKLYIVCSFDKNIKKFFEDKIKKLSLNNYICLKGYVSDTELINLYQKAIGFIFPSLYEGFGLPALEALACGLPIACSRVSSLPEICEDMALYFDPYDLNDIAKAINMLLHKPVDYKSRIKRYNYTRRFQWSKSALNVVNVFNKICRPIRNNTLKKSNSSKKIAWVTPVTPQKSGVSNYSFEFAKRLKKFVDIDIYYNPEYGMPECFVINEFSTYPIYLLVKNLSMYDFIIYHIGNNMLHKNIYKLAWNYPSIVVLHDFNIHPFLQHAFFMTKEDSYYRQALIEGYGDKGLHAYNEAKQKGFPDVFQFPLSHALVNRSKQVIVHHRWVKEQLGNLKHVKVIPHFAKINYYPSEDEVFYFKKKYNIASHHFLIACIGFINKNKLPDLQVRVIKRLIDNGYLIKMVFAGELSPECNHLRRDILNSNYKDYFVFTGYQTEQDYFRSIFAADILINLRKPTMGEASGTLLHILAAGKPVIVSDLCQYKEFPDNVCWKIPHDGYEEDYLFEYLKELLSNPILRKKMGRNAKNYSELFNIDYCVRLFCQNVLEVDL